MDPSGRFRDNTPVRISDVSGTSSAGIKGKVEFKGNQASGDYPAMCSRMNIETGQSGSATGD